MHSPVSLRHAFLLNFVERLLAAYVEQRDLGQVFGEVVAVRLSLRSVFLPDVSFYRTDRLHLLRETVIDGPPDLAVEALSPRTADRDLVTKFAEYERHGVAEYWILDPETLAHRFYARAGGRLIQFAHDDDTIESRAAPGFFIRRAWLDPAALPKVSTCVEEILARRR